MVQPSESQQNREHIVNILVGSDASSSGSSTVNTSRTLDSPRTENSRTRNASASVAVQSSFSTNSDYRSSNAAYPSVHASLVCIKLTYTLSLIVAAMIVLLISRKEKPKNPWFAWILIYLIGCVASIPVLFHHHFVEHVTLLSLLDHVKLLLESFMAFWFLVGNFWVFADKSSPENSNLYRLCVAFLAVDYVKYVSPFILCCVAICCGTSWLGQVDGGAPTGTIYDLPIYRFNSRRNGNDNREQKNEKTNTGGIIAAGTERERVFFNEDAICCICMVNYEDNDVLKELPCSHLFHVNCVDTWLKINASCPLCKCRVGKTSEDKEASSTSSPGEQV